ncbi:MAG TPA: alcohol dehydrogenase catalytic domain-containing protein [Tepidisphaeraceae bacterium]|nr:alcohol dehydrogenase catalytic domain-containing protein [Tepidisphaeraceae bacterium]
MGDRVIVYHINGCGVCEDCRHGYMISCCPECGTLVANT